ncbi:HipA domain-containing protein [Faecalibacillus intestinalis]|uniref:XRE family transcriptional regulator n=1 Tax=Faecalibacillus intestinalis TaxID=1982626 RepID=UPI0022E3EB8D|nr:XRE family transcriptional regulator [Faecalibacillus intestinalis]
MKTEKNDIYVLKIFDIPLIEFKFNKDILSLNTVHIIKIHNNHKKLFPFSLMLSDDGLAIWLKRRSAPRKRRNMKELMKNMELNINNIQSLLDISKGLSLNDAYWICKKDKDDKYDDVNLYDNSFSNEISFAAFSGLNGEFDLLSLKSPSPEFTTAGLLPKGWKKAKNDIVLFKGGINPKQDKNLEPYSEYYASQIAKRLGYRHVEYDLKEWNGILASTCKIFTSKDAGYIPIAYYVPSGNIGDINEFLKKISIENDILSNVYLDFQRMILFDALIYNKDRHFGNFGLLVNNHTMEIIGLCPIFDNGASLFSYADDFEMKDFSSLKKYAKNNCTSYYGISFNDLVKAICTKNMIADLEKLKNFKFVRHLKYNLSESRLKLIEDFVRERADELINILK